MFVHTPYAEPLGVSQVDTPKGRFYSTPDGAFPSITTVLSSEEKPAIRNWRNMLGETEANRQVKHATDRGTAIHAMAELYLRNQQIGSSNFSTDDLNLFNSLRMYLNKISNVRALELPLWSAELGVAGRVDCIAEYNGKLSVIDFKTSNNDKSEKMIGDYFLQTTAYAMMAFEQYGELIDQVVIIMAVERGLVPLVFKRSIHPYVEPLLERISNFYQQKLGVRE